MKTLIYIFLLLFIMTPKIFSEQITEKLSVGGAFFGALNMTDSNSNQFDYSSNLDLGYQVSEKIAIDVQLQMGVGASRLGFLTNKVELATLAMHYKLSRHQTLFSFGLIDLPLGINIKKLTAHADASKQLFFY